MHFGSFELDLAPLGLEKELRSCSSCSSENFDSELIRCWKLVVQLAAAFAATGYRLDWCYRTLDACSAFAVQIGYWPDLQ